LDKNQWENAMSCASSSLYPLVVMSDLDVDDFRFGQSIVLAAGLSVVVAGRVLVLLFSGL
jgi:hypothetical protein